VSDLLKSGERLDDLNRNGYHVIQNPNKFCFGMDAVLLVGFVKVATGETVADLGTGNGIIPILLRGRTKGRHFTGLEINPYSTDMARRSVLLNHLEGDIEIINGDIKEAGSIFKDKKFDVVVSNPPYIPYKDGIISEERDIAIARHEILCTLEDVIREGANILANYGRYYMVHKPERLPEILNTFSKYKLEPKRLRFVHPYVHKEPTMVLVECHHARNPGIRVEPPLIIHQDKGIYTDEVTEMYGF